MIVVVDASVAVLWTIGTPLSGHAEKLLRPGVNLIAPDFVIVETTNAFFTSIRNRMDRVERALDGLEFLPRWFSELVPAVTLRHRAMTYAMELDHPAYDCFYLALAVSRDVPLVTTDEHFVRKAKSLYGRNIKHLRDWTP